jgi:membrane associated rhomboid family serine protease
MRTLGRVLSVVLGATIALLEACGARGTRWEWRKQAWRRSLEESIAGWENLARGVRTRMRMCRSCRTLVTAGESTCPACGASLRGIPTGGLRRALGFIMPGAATLSMVLISANVVMSLLVLILWGVSAEEGGGLMSLLAPPWQALFVFGAKETRAILSGEVWRLVTANYLHGGLIHLLVNCYSLASLGPLIEESFGARKLLVIYSASGVCAFIASTLLSPRSLTVGASGAIFGLLGFAVVYGRLRGGSTGRLISDHLLRWVVLGLLMFLMPQIDSIAHVGGLLAGGLLGLFVEAGEPRSHGWDVALTIVASATALATLGSFIAMALSYEANLHLVGR